MVVASIPRIAYGIGTAWYKPQPGNLNRALIDAIKSALDVGYRHLDNAEVYGNEEECGVALKEAGVDRDELWITTKLGPKSVRDPVSALTTSLKKLQIDRVDLYLIHMPFFDWSGENEGRLEETWHGMEECVKRGLARSIGVSNFRIQELKRIAKVATLPIFANQVETHPYNAQPDLHAYMTHNDILGESYSPLASLVHKTDGPLNEPVAEMAKRYGRTEGQVLLRWNYQKGNVVITTSGKIDRMKEQLAILEFELTESDVKTIDTVGAQLHFRKYFPKELDDE